MSRPEPMESESESFPTSFQSLQDRPLVEGEERSNGTAPFPCPTCGATVNIWFRMREGQTWAFRRCDYCDQE